jgi:hypothetical protein
VEVATNTPGKTVASFSAAVTPTKAPTKTTAVTPARGKAPTPTSALLAKTASGSLPKRSHEKVAHSPPLHFSSEDREEMVSETPRRKKSRVEKEKRKHRERVG